MDRIANNGLASFIRFILNVAVVFSFSFTLTLGFGLLGFRKRPEEERRKALEFFLISLVPFALFLFYMIKIIIPAKLYFGIAFDYV